MTVDTSKSVVHLVEDLIGINGNTPAIKDIIKSASVATSNPADIANTAGASAGVTATATVTGVAAGDVVLGYGVVSGLAANQFIGGAWVSGTDTVTVSFFGPAATAVTTTAVTMNFIIADVT